ncbi:MAG: hypothetical protein ACJAXJ_004351, partial [Colwellia sp.]
KITGWLFLAIHHSIKFYQDLTKSLTHCLYNIGSNKRCFFI